MDLFHKFGERKHENINRFKKLLHVDSLGFQTEKLMHLIIIRLPNSWVLKLMTRALILSLIMLSVPWLNVVIRDMGASDFNNHVSTDDAAATTTAYSFPIMLFPSLYKDFANEGFLKTGDKILFLSNGDDYDNVLLTTIGIDVTYKIDMMSLNDFKIKSSLIPEGTYDFVLVYDFPSSSSLINRILKPLGIVVVLLRETNASRPTIQKPMNYKIIYLRRKLGSTVMAMRKLYNAVSDREEGSISMGGQGRRLLGVATESKKAVLRNLEDVLLEPPRAASGKSTRYKKKTKYLPDLIGDSLSSYPRRVFIDVNLVDKNNTSGDDDESWFSKHYPTRNTKFEIYKVDAITAGSEEKKIQPVIGMSDWLRKNVKENEYVVMKAEAEVVDEMMNTKAIRLVDELFLECKHRGIRKSERRSRRAYWECLALYGRLRDEGIAVHQWWG